MDVLETLERSGSPRPPRPPIRKYVGSDSSDDEEGRGGHNGSLDEATGLSRVPSCEPIESKYELKPKVLGKGSIALVKEAKHRETQEEVAVKVVLKSKVKNPDHLAREIDILQRIDHPHCVKFNEVYETKLEFYIVMELVNGGELLDRIIDKEYYSESEAALVFVQMISAIEYIHSIGIVHRDLKPDNILYKSTDEKSPIKIADFGMAKLHSVQDEFDPMKTMCGTPIYMAPEVCEKRGYGRECDVWSAGVIMYILLCGFPPFSQDQSVAAIYDQIRKGEYEFPEPFWDEVSPEGIDLVKRMLCMDVNKRITCKEALEHTWVGKFHSGDLPKAHMKHMRGKLKEFKMQLTSVRDLLVLVQLGIDTEKFTE